jgi:hypothetical protein
VGIVSHLSPGCSVWILIDKPELNLHLFASPVRRIREAGAERKASAVGEKQYQRNADGVEKDVGNRSESVGHTTLIPFIQDGDPDSQESRYGVVDPIV